MKVGLGLLVGLIVLYILMFTDLKNFVSVENVESFLAPYGMLGPLVFCLIYIALILVFFPAAALTVLAGILFGALWGTVYVVIAATIAAGLAFLISRYFSSNLDFIRKHRYVEGLVKRVEKQLGEKGLQTFIILRLLYLPYMALSYASGLVRSAKLWEFSVATFLTNIVGSFTFAYFGSSIRSGPRALILPVILIGLTLLVPKIVKKLQRKKIVET